MSAGCHFVTSGESRYAQRKTMSWREAAGERLWLLSEDRQNRRIINAVFESLEIKAKPPIVSNPFLVVCSYLRHGGFASIVPHTFFYVFAGSRDLVGIDLVEPMHGQVIGFVLTDRDPLPPMANALIATTRRADFVNGLAAAAPGKHDQSSYQSFKRFHWIKIVFRESLSSLKRENSYLLNLERIAPLLIFNNDTM